MTPRRARCGDCGVTQILLPSTLTVRRADSSEVIGTALAAGAGSRAIAAGLDRPTSTVRSWLRRMPDAYARWLYERAVDRAVQIDRELLVRPAVFPTLLGHALNLLAGAVLRYRAEHPTLRRHGRGKTAVCGGAACPVSRDRAGSRPRRVQRVGPARVPDRGTR